MLNGKGPMCPRVDQGFFLTDFQMWNLAWYCDMIPRGSRRLLISNKSIGKLSRLCDTYALLSNFKSPPLQECHSITNMVPDIKEYTARIDYLHKLVWEVLGWDLFHVLPVHDGEIMYLIWELLRQVCPSSLCWQCYWCELPPGLWPNKWPHGASCSYTYIFTNGFVAGGFFYGKDRIRRLLKAVFQTHKWLLEMIGSKGGHQCEPCKKAHSEIHQYFMSFSARSFGQGELTWPNPPTWMIANQPDLTHRNNYQVKVGLWRIRVRCWNPVYSHCECTGTISTPWWWIWYHIHELRQGLPWEPGKTWASHQPQASGHVIQN